MAPKEVDEAETQEVVALDHELRSLTSLGEVLQNERVHEAMTGVRSDEPSGSRETGVKLVRYMSRLLVRGIGENVAFALRLRGRDVEHTSISSDNFVVDLESSAAYPNSDAANPHEHAKHPNRQYSQDELKDCSHKTVMNYVIDHCRQGNRDPSVIEFSVHVKNTLRLLYNTSTAVDAEELKMARMSFHTYVMCMGIDRWKARYRLSEPLKQNWLGEMPFDDFLRRPNPFEGICGTKNNWPATTLVSSAALVKDFQRLAKTFTERNHEERADDRREWEMRKTIAQPCYEAALAAIQTGRFDSDVAQYYHVTLCQTFKDAENTSNRALKFLNANAIKNAKDDSHRPAGISLLRAYISASRAVFLAVSNLDILFQEYRQTLNNCINNGEDKKRGPKIPMQDWSPTSVQENRQDAFGHDENDGDDGLTDQFENIDDEFIPIQSQAWATGYAEWLQNSAKGIRATLYLTTFAEKNKSLVKQVYEKIQIVSNDRPSSKMQQWESTIDEIYPITDPGNLEKKEKMIYTLRALATTGVKKENQKKDRNQKDDPNEKDNSNLLFQDLNAQWNTSFTGTPHCESLFAIEYVLEVITLA